MMWSEDTFLYFDPIAKANPPYFSLTVKCKRVMFGIWVMEKRICPRALLMNKLHNSDVFLEYLSKTLDMALRNTQIFISNIL